MGAEGVMLERDEAEYNEDDYSPRLINNEAKTHEEI